MDRRLECALESSGRLDKTHAAGPTPESPPEFPIQRVRDEVLESALITFAQVMQNLLGQGPHLKTTHTEKTAKMVPWTQCQWVGLGVGGKQGEGVCTPETMLQTPAGCPIIQLNFDITYPETASDSTG